MSIPKLFQKTLTHPIQTLRSINRDTIRMALGYLKSGDLKGFSCGVAYFLGRTSGTPSYTPQIFYGVEDSSSPISFAPEASPLVSIIIPVHNQWSFTHSCLTSIQTNSSGVSYEVLIADDVSTDETCNIGEVVTGVKVVRQPTNLGFLQNCNIAAESARGKYLLFLNNDTNVQPGWLESLTALMESDETIGIAGAKLVYPDGRLQEAGGIIWRDASGWNFGWGDDPEKPEFNYVKDVDYVSGASLMVRRDLWEKVGGFDGRFAPAYYEDTDLAFQARRLGYRVVYQPRSVVVHFEGKSHGKDLKAGIKSYQERNRGLFLAKWQEILERDHFPNAQNVFRARDRCGKKKVVLVLDHYVPTHDRDAGSFFMYSLLRALILLGCKVVFWPENLFRHEPYCSGLQHMGIEVIYGPQSLEGFLQQPDRNFDAAILTRNHIAINFIDTVRRFVPRVLYHDPDLEFLREGRRMAIEGEKPGALAEIKKREFYLLENCDIIGLHSPVERDIVKDELPGARVEVIPLPVREVSLPEAPFESRSGLLFVGGTHPPNADGLAFFLREVYPLIRKIDPSIRFTVGGEVRKERLKGLDLEGVEFTGYLQDLRPLYEKARVFVAPLRYGAGIKGKILEAMTFGLPVVTTGIGGEGIGLLDGKTALIAEGAEAFARGVCRLQGDGDLWQFMRDQAMEHIALNYTQKIFRDKVGATMEHLFTMVPNQTG